MSDWVRKIIDRLTPANIHQVLVCDPDWLFSYEVVKKAFEAEGYEIFLTTSALDARRLYELELHGCKKRRLLVVESAYSPRPDMVSAVHVATIGYADLFPYFDAAALKGLSYNALCSLHELRPYEILGYDGTIRFLLENLYHVDLQALESSKTKERWLAALIDVVFHEDGMNAPVREYLYQEGRVRLAPLGKDILERESLSAYLRESIKAMATGSEPDCNISEPLLQKALSGLIVRRFLESEQIGNDLYESLDARQRLFFHVDSEEESGQRFDSLVAQLDGITSAIQDVPTEWLDLGPLLGESYFLALSAKSENKLERLAASIEAINQRFQDFVDRYYWQMFSLSGTRRPLSVTRVLDFMRAQSERRKALIVIDGMNVWQWHQLSVLLEAANLPVKTSAVFSYLPSITAWSRQALFRGGKPDLSVGTEVEKKTFSDYWQSRGYAESEIAYGRFDSMTPLELSSYPGVEAIGAVCTDLDDLMHGALLGNAQLFQDSSTWIQKTGIVSAIRLLLQAGYRCYVTSDHGNIEARGIGSLPMKTRCLSNSRSKRHIEFATADLARDYMQAHPDMQLSQREATVFLRDTSAFVSDSLVVTHGGSHLLEMLVPLGIVG
ncbi:MAG: PglZ domain-containing protein [Rectinemataceae bacterium]